ncbi:MAG: PQ-loop repeat-containing protein [Kocuria palustris]|nr:PQ-loop repeat-containing protein [Kocuria palustris]
MPQIYKNYSEKSCEGIFYYQCVCEPGADLYLGLSLLFFILSLLGNLTYGAGVSDTASCTINWAQANGMDIDSLPLYRERIFPHQSSMANWIAGNYG